MSEVIINKVAESGLVTIDLEEMLPQESVETFDLKDFLFMQLILKEKEFRTALQQFDWSIYNNKIVTITCSVDAIIPLWANMLVTVYLQPIAKHIFYGNTGQTTTNYLLQKINELDTNEFAEKRIVVKGCGKQKIGEAAYIAITQRLLPVAKSIMFGEPCSTVPIYKKKG